MHEGEQPDKLRGALPDRMIKKNGQSSKKKRREERAKKRAKIPKPEISIVVDSRKARAQQAVVIQDAKLKASVRRTPNKRWRRRH